MLGRMWGTQKRAGLTLTRWPPPALETQTEKVGLTAIHGVTGSGLPLSGSSSEKPWAAGVGEGTVPSKPLLLLIFLFGGPQTWKNTQCSEKLQA